MAETSLMSQIVMKNLQDKMYDKRRNAAAEIETIVHSMVSHHDTKSANSILSSLKEYVNSMHDNSRKGGLMGFAAVARGLGRVGYYTTSLNNFINTNSDLFFVSYF
jgi:vacuole morphology and inheritance protein 14